MGGQGWEFSGNQSLALRSSSRGAGNKQCRQESGRRINLKKKLTGLLVTALLKRGQAGITDSAEV